MKQTTDKEVLPQWLNDFLTSEFKEFETISVTDNRYMAKPVFIEDENLESNFQTEEYKRNGHRIRIRQFSPIYAHKSYTVAYRILDKPKTDKEVLHTQGEWKVRNRAFGSNEFALFGENDEYIGVISFSVGSHKELKHWRAKGKANLELIVKAVNNYQSLLDSNRELLDIAQKIFDDINDKKITAKSGIVPDSYVWHKLQTAINNAKQINK